MRIRWALGDPALPAYIRSPGRERAARTDQLASPPLALMRLRGTARTAKSQLVAAVQRRRLDRLSWALAEVGWASETRYGELVPALRVFHLALPTVGETISIRPHDAVWRGWFYDSCGDPVAGCRDLVGAVARIDELLTPCRLAVTRLAERPEPDDRGRS